MRTPNRTVTKDTFSESNYIPGAHVIVPGGGDGTYPTTPNPGSNTGTTTPVVFFYDRTLGTPTVWTWTFMSGSTTLGTSTQQNPSFTFPSAGTYTVTLVTNVSTLVSKTVTVV